ncbi:MAG: ZIP family metal transporter [Caldanaerobacter sp.]|uniref:ZIP family metal transporter n=1 Tax=Caldanaerobacter sp. TaxID=2930036 RepID=UPI003C739B8F
MSNSEIMLVGAFAGVIGTGCGGVFAYFLKKPKPRFFSGIMGLVAGLMLSVVMFDLLPHAFEVSGIFVGIMGVIVGALVISFMDEYIENTKFNRSFIKGGMLLGAAIALHNFPEGLAVGSGFMVSSSLGIDIALVIAIHDFPEGIAVAVPLSAGGVSPCKVLLYTFLTGLPTVFGTFIGILSGGISDTFIGLDLALAGGAMLYVTCGEIIPEARSIYKGKISVLGMILGVIGGIIITRYL